MFTIRSGQMGERELNIESARVVGSGDINMPAFQVSQEGVTNTRTTSTTVYDDLGRAHTLILDFVQFDVNEWKYSARFMEGEAKNRWEEGGGRIGEMGEML